MVEEFTENQRSEIQDIIRQYKNVQLISHRGHSPPGGDAMLVRYDPPTEGFNEFRVLKMKVSDGVEVKFGDDYMGVSYTKSFSKFLDTFEDHLIDMTDDF